MYKANSYQAVSEDPFIQVSGMALLDLIVIDRNGIGIKYSSTFNNIQITNVYTYEWYGVKTGTLTGGNYLIALYNITTAFNREILYEFGPTPVEGTVYSVYNGSNVAKYTVQSGDTDGDVRDGLKAAIDATVWGFNVTTGSVSYNQLQVNIDTLDDLIIKLGAEKFKKGRYVILDNINYIVVEAESDTGYPSIPVVSASYDYVNLKQIADSIENYLFEPLTTYTYTDSLTQTTNITNVPGSGSVNPGECVIDELNQKIWFDGNLNAGEIIKVFQK